MDSGGNTMSSAEVPHKRPKGRSPSYPAIDLEDAIERTRQLYEKERQHPAPVQAVAMHWQYRSLNGPASLAIAACKKFGLLEDEGNGPNRLAHVSDLAIEILEHPDEAVRREAIDRAALMPPIHREMWEKYGMEMPSDQTVRWFLTRERGFTETGAAEFIPEYRSTIAFARVFGTGNVGTQDESDEDPNDDEGQHVDLESKNQTQRKTERRSKMTTTAGVDTYFVPIAAGVNVAVEGPFPLTESQWSQFQAVLNAMKPALVSDGQLDEESE
jgi:hypothetical protein